MANVRYLYVVKSGFGNYATINAAAYPVDDDEDFGLEPTTMVWTEKRSQAAHFTSRAAARALAEHCPNARARVVRVKR